MAAPQGGINWLTWSIADFLEAAALMTPQELAAYLRDMKQQTGVSIPIVTALTSAGVTGPDAAGVTITGNPVLIGGNNNGTLRSLFVDANGAPIVRAAADDQSNSRAMLADRTGILAVAPPVSKLASQAATLTGAGAAPSFTIAAPGAGLRIVLLSALFTASAGATAFPGTLAGGQFGPLAPFAFACPANDVRYVPFEGPQINPANTAVTIAGVAGVAGGVQYVSACWYIASFP